MYRKAYSVILSSVLLGALSCTLSALAIADENVDEDAQDLTVAGAVESDSKIKYTSIPGIAFTRATYEFLDTDSKISIADALSCKQGVSSFGNAFIKDVALPHGHTVDRIDLVGLDISLNTDIDLRFQQRCYDGAQSKEITTLAELSSKNAPGEFIEFAPLDVTIDNQQCNYYVEALLGGLTCEGAGSQQLRRVVFQHAKSKQ